MAKKEYKIIEAKSVSNGRLVKVTYRDSDNNEEVYIPSSHNEIKDFLSLTEVENLAHANVCIFIISGAAVGGQATLKA